VRCGLDPLARNVETYAYVARCVPDPPRGREVSSERSRLVDRVPEGEANSPVLDSELVLGAFLEWLEHQGVEPYAAQEEAFLELLAGHHVILGTPTGSGKTLVAALLHFKALCERRRSFYTCPTKALASEKFFWLCEEFGAENVGMMTGDAGINPDALVVCCTTEVLAQMALRRGSLTPVPYVIMDEFHYYSDRARGTAWQIPLLVLSRTQFLLMSATFGDPRQISERLQARSGRQVRAIFSDDRPVPLDFDYRETSLQETVEELLQDGKSPIYIVHFTQREAAEQAQGLTSAKISTREERDRIRAAIGDFRFNTPYGKELRRFLGFGIGVHHAGLLPKHRLLVEQLSQQGLLKVICGTDTLGVGVNIPIRTVLFAKLCKFDGEKLGILGPREFRQIAGRAGRRGFDDLGSVVCQAPEHVIERKRALRSAGGAKKLAKKSPGRGTRPGVSWTESTFERLIHQDQDPLRSEFRLTHGVLVHVLQRDAGTPEGEGYAAVIDLIDRSHESPVRKHRLRRDAAAIFRSLRRAGVVEIGPDLATGRRVVRVGSDLQDDFSLHHALSLYLVDAVGALDMEQPDYALDVLSIVEAILENPRGVLIQQEKRARGDLVAQLKAEGVPYEDRMRRLEEVTYPKPLAQFLDETFHLFAERHPWVSSEEIKPKSIAREMYEKYMDFMEYVRHYGIARIEGTLLRYLGDVYRTLTQNVPIHAKNEVLYDIEAFLRSDLGRVDQSLFEEWESLRYPGREGEATEAAGERLPRIDARVFRARLRSEVHGLLRSLSRQDYADAVQRVLAIDPEDVWTEERFEAALSPFYEEYAEVEFSPRARMSEWTRIELHAPLFATVTQTILDPTNDNFWYIEATADLRGRDDLEGPWLELHKIAR